MIHKIGFDGQCESCGRPIHWEQVDANGVCDHCNADAFEFNFDHLKRQYEAEKRAGLLPSQAEETRQQIMDAGRGRQVK
jgi:hypothetical protein